MPPKPGSKKKKPPSGAAAVIELSSNNIRMIIGERNKDGVRMLEFMECPLPIGKDTFTTGKLGFDKVNAASEHINNYIKAAEGYGVRRRDIRVIATSALREAMNKTYILDQIHLKTGMEVSIIDSADEKLNVFKMALRSISLSKKDEETTLMVFIGSGNVGFSVVKDGRVPFYQSVKIGPLRVSELFDDLAHRSREYHVVVAEYIRTFLNPKTTLLPPNITRLVMMGGDISVIKTLCGKGTGNGDYLIDRKDFDELYNRVKQASKESIAQDLNLPLYRADIIIPALSIIANFFDLTGLDAALVPPAYLNESMLYRVLYPDLSNSSDKNFYKNTLLCAKSIAAHYCINEAHSALVEDFSVKIFDKIRKIHGMGARERTLLQCAAHLHDCGKFVGVNDHAANSYSIIMGLDIIGFNKTDQRILAMICLLHSSAPPENFNAYVYMPDPEKTATAKLAAILRLADALDRGASQKIKEIDVSQDGDSLIIHVKTNRNIDLEKWAFNVKRAFFREVFGVDAVIKVKTTQ